MYIMWEWQTTSPIFSSRTHRISNLHMQDHKNLLSSFIISVYIWICFKFFSGKHPNISKRAIFNTDLFDMWDYTTIFQNGGEWSSDQFWWTKNVSNSLFFCFKFDKLGAKLYLNMESNVARKRLLSTILYKNHSKCEPYL